jgi:NAD(P)-dependent dehydrogenase (short-subunit alcohol dehydrogenase family)
MNQAKPQHVIVMTGATAGLGAHAVQRIAAQPDMRVIIGARGSGRTVPRGVEVIPLDLASLASVREFADAVMRQLGDARIDILVLNAGIQTSNNERRSADGYELTFAVNHLAHYLLARLLLPRMADHGRLVITTSETHDPAVTPIGPKTLEPQVLARPSWPKSLWGLSPHRPTGSTSPWSRANRRSLTRRNWREGEKLRIGCGAKAQRWWASSKDRGEIHNESA